MPAIHSKEKKQSLSLLEAMQQPHRSNRAALFHRFHEPNKVATPNPEVEEEGKELVKYLKAQGEWTQHMKDRVALMQLIDPTVEEWHAVTAEFAHRSNEGSRLHYSGRFWCEHHQRHELIVMRGYKYSAEQKKLAAYSDNAAWIRAHRHQVELCRSVYQILLANDHLKKDSDERLEEFLENHGSIVMEERESSLLDLTKLTRLRDYYQRFKEEEKNLDADRPLSDLKQIVKCEKTIGSKIRDAKGRKDCSCCMYDMFEHGFISAEDFVQYTGNEKDKIYNTRVHVKEDKKYNRTRASVTAECVLCKRRQNKVHKLKNHDHLKVQWRNQKKKNPGKHKISQKTEYLKKRLMALRIIDPSVSCAKCGNSTLAELQIDHINEDGNTHRESIGDNIIYWVIHNAEEARQRLQILCGSCHKGKTYKNKQKRKAVRSEAAGSKVKQRKIEE